jgi:hypothetical protein
MQKSRIEKEWDEGNPDSGGDGYWISLCKGWKWAGEPVGALHTIHEKTKRQARRQSVIPCDCPDCAK